MFNLSLSSCRYGNELTIDDNSTIESATAAVTATVSPDVGSVTVHLAATAADAITGKDGNLLYLAGPPARISS